MGTWFLMAVDFIYLHYVYITSSSIKKGFLNKYLLLTKGSSLTWIKGIQFEFLLIQVKKCPHKGKWDNIFLIFVWFTKFVNQYFLAEQVQNGSKNWEECRSRNMKHFYDLENIMRNVELIHMFDGFASDFYVVTHFSPHWQCPCHRINICWAVFQEHMNLQR